MQTSYSKSLPAYFMVMYLIFFLTNALYLLHIDIEMLSTVILIMGALIFYPFLMIFPSILIVSALCLALRKKSEKIRLNITWSAAFVLFSILHLVVLMDTGLYYRYGYHINPHVLNIFTTPGGFEGMGMRPNEIMLLAGGLVGLLLFHGLLVFGFSRKKVFSFCGDWQWQNKASVYIRYGSVL